MVVEQEYKLEGLQQLETREEGESEYVEAYSDLGDLEVREKPEELEFVWETDAGFAEVLEAVESLYRRKNGIQALEKNGYGGLDQTKIRDYVLEGPLEEDGIGDWEEFHILQIGGSDFYVSWDSKAEGRDHRIRLNAQGSGLAPFESVYRKTVDDEGVEDVISDVEDEFFDHPRSFPGFWDPTDRYN